MKRPLLWLAGVCFAAQSAAAVEITLLTDGLRASGVTRGGRVAIAAAAREESAPGLNSRLTQIAEVVEDRDGDGSIEFRLNRPLPVHSVWIVIDQKSGEFAAATPVGFTNREMAAPADLVKNVAAEDLDQLVSDRFVSALLWVQPGNGGGVWSIRTADGAANDEDHASNGRAVVSASAFQSLGGSERAPKKLKTGDVVAIVDPFELRYVVVQVTKR